MKILSAQSPAHPSSPRIRRLRLIGEIGAALVGTLLGAALSLAAAPAGARSGAARGDHTPTHAATTDHAWPS